MNIELAPGTHVVAVSGGVDSMVLLDVLRQLPDVRLVAAHFDHGIRSDSVLDRELVQKTAKQYNLPFIYESTQLGVGACEAVARTARYAFLERAKSEHQAVAIITAHHQDDMLETAVLNMLRGTGRKGLSSLHSSTSLVRPLLGWSKQDILLYAEQHNIIWREDSTNADDQYLRNYVRHNILTRFSLKDRMALLTHIQQARKVNQQIDALLHAELDTQIARSEINRRWFAQLPYAVSAEMMAMFLRRNDITGFDRVLIDRLVVVAKTARPGKLADIMAGAVLHIEKDNLKITHRTTRNN